jgi:hypothetical protein
MAEGCTLWKNGLANTQNMGSRRERRARERRKAEAAEDEGIIKRDGEKRKRERKG